MRAGHWVSWLSFLALAASQDDVDSEQSRKVLGSSVVTSVSVIMDHGNGTKTYIADAAGQPITQNEGPVGSPGELLAPDRYEFYTFDESGDLVKRLMTLDQIQGLIAGGDNDAMNSDASAPMYYHENLSTDSNGHMDVTDMDISDVQGVHNVVASVQNVLKSELEATRKKPTSSKPLAVLNMPDAASSWSILLPAVLGAGDSGIMATADESSDMERITLTEVPNKTEATTTTTKVFTTVITTTEEPTTTIKYVTKRPTDSPTVVHYLPIQNIPTKKPIQTVKVSNKPSVTSPTKVPPTTPTSSAVPVMDELSASLSSVIAQVTDVKNHTTTAPAVTPTEMSNAKAPEKNSTENIEEKSNLSTLNENASDPPVKNETSEESLEPEISVRNITTTAIDDSLSLKQEALEAQSSNANTPTYDKIMIEISTSPSKNTAEELLTERRKPPTTIDESLKEFISTTITGSDFSIKPIHIDTSTENLIEIKEPTTITEVSSTTPAKIPSKPTTNTSKLPTLKPINSKVTDTDQASSETPTTSNQYYSSSTTNSDLMMVSQVNTTKINKTNQESTNSRIDVIQTDKLTNNISSTVENDSENVMLRNSPTTIKPTKLESSTSNSVSENKPLSNITTNFLDEASVLTQLATSLSSQNSSAFLNPFTYNTTVLNTDSTTTQLLELPQNTKNTPAFTPTIKPTKSETVTTKTPIPESSSSQEYIDRPNGSVSTESVLATIITGFVTKPNNRVTAKPINATNTETYLTPTTVVPDKVKPKNNTDNYSASESKVVSNSINSTDAVVDSVTSGPNNKTTTKPLKPMEEDFTITTYKPSTNQPIQISTNTSSEIKNNTVLSTLRPTVEAEPQNITDLKSDQESGPPTNIKFKTAESQNIVSGSLLSSSENSPATSVIIQKVQPSLLSTIPSDYDAQGSTSLPNTDTTTESSTFITVTASETDSTESSYNMEDELSVHESISAVTNILLGDKPNEPPNEPQIPLPTIIGGASSSKEPKPANGELKHASIGNDDYNPTTEILDTSTTAVTDESDSTTTSESYITESTSKDSNANKMESSSSSISDGNSGILNSSIYAANDTSTEEINSTENSYEISTNSMTTAQDDNLTTTGETFENISTLSTTKIEQNFGNESSVRQTVMQAIPTKESKLNPDQVSEGEPSNIHVNVDDSLIDEKETLIAVNKTNANVTSEYTTPEPILISSSNDKKEVTSSTSTTENTSVKSDATPSDKVDKETVHEKISLKTAAKPDDTKSQLSKKPVQNVYRPLPDPPLTPPTAVELHPAPHESMGLEASTAFLGDDVRRFSDLCNELAFRMWTSITGKGSITSRSLVFSPFSATSLLAMVFLGARGPTSGQMNDILRLDDMVTFNPHQVLQNVTESVLNSRNYGVATAAFIRELYSDKAKGKILDFYKERAQQYYDGHVEEIAFNVIGDILRRRTNLLVKRQTLGRIPEYLRGSGLNLRPPLAAFSANIFQTDCEQASIDGRDGEMYFVVRPSTRQRRLVPVPAAVWRSGFLAGYEPSLDATVVSLGTDTVVSTLLVLPGQQGQVAPGDGLARLEQRLIETSYRRGGWSRLLRSLLPRPGLELQVPRFSHRSVLNVTGALQRMGLKDLFNEGRADLRGLNGLSNELFLSDMVQVNTFSTCGEEAIGARHHVETYPVSPQRMGREEPELYPDFEDDDSIYMSIPLSLRPRQARLPDNPRLRFDRPFLYMVRHNPTGMILYMGRFNPRLLP